MTPPRRSIALPGLLLLAVLGGFTAASCGGSNGDTGNTGQGDGGGDSTINGDGANGGDGTGGDAAGSGDSNLAEGGTNYQCPGCPSFPGLGAPQCAPSVLGPATIAYPLDGILLPPNMNVLEVQFVPPPNATLFEVDFRNSVTLVKVETKCNAVPDVRGGMSRGCGVTLPQGAWNDIANLNREGDPVHVEVRATIDGSCVTASQTKVDISFAKEDLAGGIYYWQSATFGGIGGTTGGIYSHDFGTFDPTPTPFYTSGGSGTCVGCHTLSRDGVRMSLMTDDPDGDDEFGDVKTHVMDVGSRTVLGGAMMSPGFQTFSHDHAVMVATTFKGGGGGPGGGMPDMSFAVWSGDGTTLLSTQSLGGTIAATQPDLSKDDATLIYVVPQAGTISRQGDHHFLGGSLYSSTFNAATYAVGAPSPFLMSDGTVNYYYPTLSPALTFVVFNAAANAPATATANGDSFYNRGARVKLLHYPPNGTKPLDLPALNVADGLTNSWPRWSPFVQSYKGHKLLWVTFSSNRDYGLHLGNKGFDNCYPPESPTYDQPQPLSKQGVSYANCAQPQIWMAAIDVDEDPSLDAKDRSFPAFWLPFQDVNSHNHSAQWVEQVQGPPGTGDGGVSDGGGSEAGGTCNESGGACGASSICCSDVVCCSGTCQFTCLK